MPLDSVARIGRSLAHSLLSPRISAGTSTPSLQLYCRKISQNNKERSPPPHFRGHNAHSSAPDTPSAADAVAHLRKIFPPLEFPEDVAQRMTTHISWNRGVDGHNGRLGFVGRRVLHTYLLLFLHECSLPPKGYTHPKSAPAPPSSRLRQSALLSSSDMPSELYDDISDRLLNTYLLGEHVGAAWGLERIMRWTPSISVLDAGRAASRDTVLRSSGLYKVRGATVEGVIGGIFYHFGGAIAHRVFHTRLLPHIVRFGLPDSLRTRADEACERLGGREGPLTRPSVRTRRRADEDEGHRPYPVKAESSDDRKDADFTKLSNSRRRSEELQKLGYVI